MDNKMKFKFVINGDRVEVYEYSVPITCGKSREFEVIRKDTSDKEEKELQKREDNLYRARQNIRRLIWSNQGKYTKFVTLTYAKTVLEVKPVKRAITTFVQAMRRLGYDMKYLYVLERQKERGRKEGNIGCVHVHMLIFIDKYIPYEDINKCWKHGNTDIEAIDNIKNLGAYVCKYITKENIADFGNHCYERSQNLKSPDIERFYVGNYSDSCLDISPWEILKKLKIDYKAVTRHDYISEIDGSAQHQTVTYYQGTFDSPDFMEEVRKLYELKRQINYLHIS